jgi:hypothetical protein
MAETRTFLNELEKNGILNGVLNDTPFNINIKEIVLFESRKKSTTTELIILDGKWDSNERFIYVIIQLNNGNYVVFEYVSKYYGNDIEPSFDVTCYVYHKTHVSKVYVNTYIPYEDYGIINDNMPITDWYIKNVTYVFLKYFPDDDDYSISMSNDIYEIFSTHG